MSRTRWLIAIAISIASAAVNAQNSSRPIDGTSDDFKVTLLGTGSPNPRPDRFGPSILVQAGSERLVFDCGRSCTTRLWQAGVPLGTVKLFITHLHSDHTVGIPDLWLTGWLALPYGGRTTPFRVWGPEGTAAMMANLQKAYEADIRIRQPQVNAAAVDAKDFTESVVFDEHGARVTAFKVAHADINAFGFRVDYKGHAVVLSGDTRPTQNFVAHAKGADLVIHEVGAANPELIEKNENIRELVATHHSTPEQAGAEFARINPKLAVFSHFSLFGRDGIPEPTPEQLIARTRTAYRGPLEIGEDLMTIWIGDSITVHRPALVR